MPYLRCNGCGVVSWSTAHAGTICPECGVPRPRRPEEVVRTSDPAHRLTSLVRMTRDLLDADVAMLTEIAGDQELVRVAAGGWPELGELAGASLPLEETYCRFMLEGAIGNLVADTRGDERVRDLAFTRECGVGAYLGVPIALADAELYVLCCLAREARPDFGPREVKRLRGLAESVRAELSAR